MINSYLKPVAIINTIISTKYNTFSLYYFHNNDLAEMANDEDENKQRW